MKHTWSPALICIVVATLSAGCRGTDSQNGAPHTASPAATPAPATGPAKADYPEPRFPSYLKPPSSIDEVMPYIRPLVRSRTGLQGAGLGIAEKGETVLFIVATDAEDMIVEAVVKGMSERGVNTIVKRDYEIVGIPREEALDYRKARRTYTSEQGYMEAANWVDANFPSLRRPRHG